MNVPNEVLPTEEAWLLFKRVVGERVETDADLKPVAEEVAKECGGLPLLIQAVGNALKDESIDSWKEALSRLKEPAPSEMDPDIEKAFTRLQLSYDYLKSKEAKSCFLLCSLFHEAEDIELEDLVRYVVGLELFNNLDSIEDARVRVQNAVNVLTSSGLLLNNKLKGYTKMHDVVRDVALLIASEGKDKYKYLLKAGKDLIKCLPRDNNVKDLTDYKKTNFDYFLGSYDSMIKMLDKKGPLRSVLKATNHYHDRNIIKDGRSGKVYKGKLRRNGLLMYIAVWRLDRRYRKNYIDFRRELTILSAFKHDNISSIFGYLDEDDENTIIYEQAFHGILQGHLKNPELTWPRRLQICLGVARALNYIHNQRLIHCDISSSKILLDEDWEPKIFGFELCTEYPQSWKHSLHTSRYLGTTSVITPKYDVYLFGELLFEVLCGKKPMFDEVGFNGKLDDIIVPSLSQHIGSQSMEFLINIAYNCLVKKLVERPSMNQIVKELEEALEQENLEYSTNRDEDASSNRLLVEFLKIPLIEIKSATNNFDEACRVGSGGFGTVYRAKLDVLDIQSVSSINGKSKHELPRKSKTVAIKRLSKKGDEHAQKGFLNEIELLTNCKHPNVVSLLGFCIEANEMILVYEYALNGSLSDYLGSELSLTWSQRLQICIQVAHGINYLHTNTEGKPRIIHRDIKSDNILLDENLNAKVSDFGLSRFHPTVGTKSTILTNNLAGTLVYIDPEYRMTDKYKKESDIYSFGVVLFEVLSGKMAYDSTYIRENDDGLAPIVRRRFNEGTLVELIDLKMLELEDDEHTFTLNIGPTQDSFDLFSKVGYECLAKTRAERPKMEVVIKRLQDALEVQGETMVLSKFRLSNIVSATQNFAKTYYMGSDTYGKVYKAQLDLFESNSVLATKGKNNGEPPIGVAIKCISGREEEHGEERFFSEIEMHTGNKHPNIVPLLGICYEGDTMLLVYEHASDESLDDYLRDTDNMTNYTWIQRLHQCLGIAHGLNHLHTLMDCKQDMIHVDIRSANILLGKSGDEAKIAYLGFSKLLPANQETSTDITNNNVRTKVYCCPEYQKTGAVKKESDIYSFGVVLFEMFCGRLAYDPIYTDKNDNGLAPIARRCFSDGTIMEMIDPALKKETSDSLGAYLRIANRCLAENHAERPTMEIVIEELEKALNIPLVANLSVASRDDTNVSETSEPDLAGFNEDVSYLFAEWYRIYELPGVNDQASARFVLQLQQTGLLKPDDTSDHFFRRLLDVAVSHCITSEGAVQSHQQTQTLSFLAIDMYASLVFSILKFSPVDHGLSKLSLMSKVLAVTVLFIQKDAEEKKTSFNPRPYFRLFIDWLLDLNTLDPVFEGANFQVLTALATSFHALQPLKVPAFSFVWLELVSHRSFMPKLLSGNAQKGWPYFQRLLVDLFQFMEPFLRNAELGEPVRFLYKGTLRVLLVLLHDFPEFLCDYHFSFCDIIPPCCIQMRNIVLSAFPRNMRLPDPSTPNLKIDLLDEISQSPRILSEVDAALKAKQMKSDVDEYLKARPQRTSFLSELKQKLLLSPTEAARAGTRYNVPLMNSLVLYVGMQAIQQLQARTPHGQPMASNASLHISHVGAALDIFQTLILELGTEGRYLFLNAVANQLRYPNNHTHYFSFILLYLFSESNQEAIQEQITRVLLERLIVNRPHSWGLLITFIELIKNPRYTFWSRSFTRCAPEIEKLFESVSRSCGGAKPVDDSVVAGGISDPMH